MPLLTGYIVAGVPVTFAERGWREFVGRSVYDRFPAGYEDLRSSVGELEADDGRVIFARLGSTRSRVSVELEYTPRDAADPAGDVARAQRELERDLGKYREFVTRRCDEQHCRR
jgi:hypothetical protein